MTMPNGPAGVNPDAKYGISQTGIATINQRTRANIEPQLKQQYFGGGGSLVPPMQWPWATMPDGPMLWSALNALGRSLLNIPNMIVNDLDFLLNQITYIPQTLTEHTEAIATLADIAAAGATTPAYVGDQDDMVSAARNDTVVFAQGAPSNSFAFSCNSSTHTHTWTAQCASAKPGYSNGVGAPSTADIWYVPIIVDRDGSYVHNIRWIGGVDPSIAGMQWYEVALCGYDPPSGAIEKIWTSGNIKDTVASTSSLQELEIDMTVSHSETGSTPGISQKLKAGQLLFAAIQQVAPGFGQSARSVGIAPWNNVQRPASMRLNHAMFYAPGYSQGIPSTIQLSDLTGYDGFIPWFAVSTTEAAP